MVLEVYVNKLTVKLHYCLYKPMSTETVDKYFITLPLKTICLMIQLLRKTTLSMIKSIFKKVLSYKL